MAFTLASGGIPGSYVFMALFACVGVLAVAIMGTETRGQSIEKTAAEPEASQLVA
jgi:hypothetical protein